MQKLKIQELKVSFLNPQSEELQSQNLLSWTQTFKTQVLTLKLKVSITDLSSLRFLTSVLQLKNSNLHFSNSKTSSLESQVPVQLKTWNFVRIGFQPRWSQIWSPIHNRTSRSVRNRVQNHFLEVLKCRYPFYKGVKYPFDFNLKGFINGVQESKSQNAKAKTPSVQGVKSSALELKDYKSRSTCRMNLAS